MPVGISPVSSNCICIRVAHCAISALGTVNIYNLCNIRRVVIECILGHWTEDHEVWGLILTVGLTVGHVSKCQANLSVPYSLGPLSVIKWVPGAQI